MSLTSLAMFIYTVILKPPPLRWLTDKVLLLLIPKQIRMSEGMITLHPHDPVISGALALGVYETYQLEVFRSVTEKGMTVLDIGANIGLYTVIAAQRVGESGKVISFEPESENFQLLQKNIMDNNFKNVQAVQVAVADVEGELILHLSKGNKGQHSLLHLENAEGEQKVKTIKVDTWLEKNNVSNVDVIKIDIQGAESLAFIGMKKTLGTKPVLFMEYEPKFIRESGYSPIGMLEMLLANDYELFSIDEASKSKKRISDIHSFTESLSGDTYANLLCV